jgi:hypothetical protein
MKYITNKISKYLLIGSIFVTLSCEVQENYNENNQRKIVIEDFSLRSIQGKTTSKLLEVANKIKSLNTTSASSKTVYNAAFDFYMDDEHGKHIVVDGQDSYTFEITRTNGDQKVENIIFNQKTDGSFETSLVKYDFSKGEFSNLSTQVTLNKDRTVTSIDTNTGTIGITSKWCIEILPDPVPTYGAYGYFKVIYVYPCYDGAGSSDNGPKTQSGWGGDGNDTGGTNNNTSNPVNTNTGGGGGAINTTPVVLASPCKKVKKQLEKFAALTPALVTLKGMTGQSNENGIFIDNTATATTPAPVQTIPPSLNAGGAIDLNMTPTNPYVIIAHTHDAFGDGTGTYSIFSFSDLLTVRDLILANHIDTDNFVFYLATADNTQYALTIDDPAEFAESLNFLGDPANPVYNKTKAEANTKIENDYYGVKAGTIKTNSNPETDKVMFLKMLKELGNNATLFEVNANFNIFTKLSLNSSNQAVPTPCSN